MFKAFEFVFPLAASRSPTVRIGSTRSRSGLLFGAEAGGDGPPLIGLSQLPRVCLREAKADPVEPAFRQAHGLNALRPMCRIGRFLARWFGRAHCRLCQALAFIAFRRDFHSSPPSYVGPRPPRSLPSFTLVSESGRPLKGIRNSDPGCLIFGSCPSSRHLHQLIRAG